MTGGVYVLKESHAKQQPVIKKQTNVSMASWCVIDRK